MDMASLSKFAGDMTISDRGRGGARGRGGDRGRVDRGGRGARGARGRREMKPTNYDCVVTRPEGLEKKGTYCSFLSYLLKFVKDHFVYFIIVKRTFYQKITRPESLSCPLG